MSRDYPKKCHKCKEEYCDDKCPALKQMKSMDTKLMKQWAKEHNRLHKQMKSEFRIFALKCKKAGMIKNDIMPRPVRCFHNNAASYTQGFSNCSLSRCPILNLER